MQQIVTPDYYKDVFCGEFDGDEKELSKLLEVAYIIIYNETCGRIAQFDSLDKKVQRLLKMLSVGRLIIYQQTAVFHSCMTAASAIFHSAVSAIRQAETVAYRMGNCLYAMRHTACFYRQVLCTKDLMRYDETYTTQSFDTHCRCCCRKNRQMGRNLRNVYGNIEICPHRTDRKLYKR